MKRESSCNDDQAASQPTPHLIRIYTDGSGARPDGKGSCFGWLREDTGEKHIRREDGLTNNQAEYRAVLFAIESMPEGSCVEILTDSQLLACQATGLYKMRDTSLKELLLRMHDLVNEKKMTLRVNWIPRERNLAGKLI
jgi:ribonuclease HI